MTAPVTAFPTDALWTGPELAEAAGGHFGASSHGVGIVVTGVSIDTRTLQPGDLFVALAGEHSDGHGHVAAALDSGAAAVLVHREPESGDDARLLYVADTLHGLWDLGRAARARFGGRVVAVTGSVGKTTTKEMLRVALGALGETHASVASYNNHWGVPLTLARLPRGAAFCISEIGMNHPGEIAPLAELVLPDVGVITTIGSAHLGHMGSREAIAREKASLIGALAPGSVAIVPDDATGQLVFADAARRADVTLWHSGFTPGSEVRLTDLELSGEGSRFVAHVAGFAVPVTIRAPGEHLARNAALALGVAGALGTGSAVTESGVASDLATGLSRAAEALSGFVPGAGRGAAVPVCRGRALLLDESYNASVLAIRAALGVLKLMPARRRIAVLGDIRELGEFASDEHLSLVGPVSDTADLVFCCGPHMKELFDALPSSLRGAWTADSAALAPLVCRSIARGDVVLVKGSLGSRMKLVVDALKAENA
ncbi:UDP-N-acetylmuramoyl-tripeptide--D-alanyl-D-alanine ligase [Acetobacter oeni]|uniref:UDP-N-acetylmuramoyl-tripeptide--D-alanyl-D-alanine ligase n=1 Tax=Acetobacter oeni TaxID=304077 RepID=A0A511XHX0_9PROT|nr:UDP-N-acetylmuramoyl-tripeptide--D-alanyl-D-alanine ligase [Acetobacter oeni]MBB3882513.1 UDP-N-acetylmuramoyl-tripeptide--D-alanyl-D-alanine ligase [Acetobacter oeni]NHO18675.1 UDP-N-acetylmuramoyl-tripeptide--D-alanyl-D-alanine ligase [Acetobacter oeni]GBR11824.1 UDP-N-acetylmuramoyl-tripeptide--D-alanyl-D-alanine ligase [Acetobacter oeni LMG 21952]GEN62550.1 UDP-N-acetylmuramoyl-tripeptide--D-alanyl-D-alanine ligase [Acetobacter oeni]